MNLNPLPVRVKALQVFNLDGQDYQPGDRLTVSWIQCKRLEKQGKAERVVEMLESQIDTIRDVMVFTPVWRLEPETVEAVLSLRWMGPLTFVFQEDNPGENPKINHLHQFQRGRKLFLAGPYDAMLIIESDIIPPEDALVKLASLGADVNYGVYRFRATNAINIFERYPVTGNPAPINVGESLSSKPQLLAQAVRDVRFPCSGAGLGCVLLRRRVLEAIEFRMEHIWGTYSDTYFTRDVFAAGFSMWADMSVVCAHKDEFGKILWPDLK